MLADLGPAGLKIVTELELFRDPSRIDFMLLLRRLRASRRRPRVLRGLWRLLSSVVIMELKTAAGPYKRGDLFLLFGSAEVYVGQHVREFRRVLDLSVVLIVPTMARSLELDLALRGWKLQPLGNGYARIEGPDYRGIVVFLDEVAEAEHDDLIGCIAHRRIQTAAAAQWLLQRGGVPERLAMAKITGFSKVFKRLMTIKEFRAEMLKDVPARERVAGLPAKERLAGVPAKERLAGVPAKARLAGLRGAQLVAALRGPDVIAAMKTLPLATRRRLAGQFGVPPSR